LHVDPTHSTKLGLLLVIGLRECDLILLSLDLKQPEVFDKRFEQTFTLAEDRKVRQVESVCMQEI
jgi:hypothetical protein